MKRVFLFTLLLLSPLFLAGQGMSHDAAARQVLRFPAEPQAPASPGATTNMAAVSAFGGTMQALATSGHYAYVSEGMSFVVFDISTPSNPVELGRTMLPDMAWEIKIVGDYAYVAAWSKGLQVVDISDPAAPSVVGSWGRADRTGWVYAVGVKNGYAYLGGYDNIVVLNVSDPASPAYVKDVGGTFSAQAMAIDGSSLYIAGSNAGLVIYDLSDPTTPALVSAFNPTGYGYTYGLALAGAYAYLADGTYGMRIVDISDPASPTQVGKYPPEGYNHSGSFRKVALGGNFAYLADDDHGLWVIDISTSTAPASHSSVAIADGVSDVAFANDHVFTAQDQFKAFSAAAGTTAPTLLGEYKSLDSINVLHAQDNTLLAAARAGQSMYQLDITNPAAPRKLAAYDALGGCEVIQIEGNKAYVGGGADENLRIFDLSTPGQIDYQGSLDTPGFVWRLSASGSLVFIGDGSNGVVVADASNPTAPSQLDHYAANFANDIAYGNGYVYVADGSDQIIVLDASDPSNLTYVSGYSLISNRLHVWGDYLVTRGTQPASFSIVDVTKPASPTLASTTFTSFSNGIVDMAVQGDLAYILGGVSGGISGSYSSLLVYDISNPASPGQIAAYDMPAGAERVTVSGKYAYVGLGGRGLLVVKLLLPRISQVDPAIGPVGWTTLINIYGDGFAAGASVEIGTAAAVSTTVMAETHIQALVPATLAAGEYAVKVTNPSGYGHTLANAFKLVDATAEGVFATADDLFTTPAPPRATETTALALHVHRVGGATALSDFTVDFYKGNPDRGGTLIGTGVVATLPPSGAATTSPVNWTPDYAVDTHIYALLGTSGIKVHREIAVLPSSTDPNAPLVSSVRINGGTGSQDTSSRTVNLQISASDVGSGLNTMWVAEWMWNPGLGSWQVIQEQGWIPYQALLGWTLSGQPGSRFIDVWVADFAGNISDKAEQAHINLLYANMWIAQDQTQCFNYDLTAGQHIQAQLNPASGDADLYVGTYDDGILYSSCQAGSAAESLAFDAPKTDWYSFIAYGYTNAMYNLAINRSALLQSQGLTDKITPTLNLPAGGPPTQMGLPHAPVETPNFPLYLPLIQRQ
ncbi:MAG: IPT/TIG domain-containing protein [Thermoflexales bacterium]|nr:IPT/TIG domain-containing protein [Thermoflexales bacterium]